MSRSVIGLADPPSGGPKQPPDFARLVESQSTARAQIDRFGVGEYAVKFRYSTASPHVTTYVGAVCKTVGVVDCMPS
jgi:hypothetical protein